MPIFLKFQAWKKIHIIFFLVLAYSISCDARIVKIVIDEVKPLPSADGGGIDTEQIAGRAFGEIDPNQKQNAIINDINLVKDKDGKVRYVATFVITKPVDAKNASGLMWHEVPNRGLKRPNVIAERANGDIDLTSAWQGDNSAQRPLEPMQQ